MSTRLLSTQILPTYRQIDRNVYWLNRTAPEFCGDEKDWPSAAYSESFLTALDTNWLGTPLSLVMDIVGMFVGWILFSLLGIPYIIAKFL